MSTNKLLHTDLSFLKLEDQISLLFIIIDDSKAALNNVQDLIEAGSDISRHILFKTFLLTEQHGKKSWIDKFVEAASIIQNYRLLTKLGYSKDNVLTEYLPQHLSTGLLVDRVKKILYKLCDQLTIEQTKRFIRLVEDKTSNSSSDNHLYLELMILKWCDCGLISIDGAQLTNLDKILKILKVYEMDILKQELESAILNKNKEKLCEKESEQVVKPKIVQDASYYDIFDENILGYCIVVNEKHFYKSELKEYKHLLPETDFDSRLGTDCDVEHLKETFAALGFEVVAYDDLDYDLFMQLLDYYSQIIPTFHSFFVLVVLSHGSENVVYSCDSIPINVESIELKFQGHNCPNLINKPKLFIIQSCQGPDWQQNIQTDNISQVRNKQIGPERGDAMIAWSTVKGFASFRDKYNGSWFIQEICKQLWSCECNDFVDVLCEVNRRLREKTHEGQVMIPWLSLSLCKKIRFPIKRFRKVAATKLMLERLLFDACLKQMLLEVAENDANKLQM